jgi:hypothetical protein
MTLLQCAPAAQTKPSPDYLLDTPLPQLLVELDAELALVPVDDDTICGVTEVRGSRIRLSLSSFWPESVRDAMARAMLGVALRVPLPALPEPFAVTEL